MGIVTKQARKLYDALVLRGIPCETEGKIGKKHVDIVLRQSRICIEVDGDYHYVNPGQIVRDIHRDEHSIEDGYHTIRIPNDMIEKHLDEIADSIMEIAKYNHN